MRLHVAMSKNINVARLLGCYVATLRGVDNRNTTTDTYDRGCIFSDIHGGMSLQDSRNILRYTDNTHRRDIPPCMSEIPPPTPTIEDVFFRTYTGVCPY